MFARAIIFFLLTFIAAGCRDPQVKPTSPITIGLPNVLSMGLIIYAQEKGLFTAEGLDVKLVFYPTGREASEALFRNDVDLAAAFSTVFVFNHMKGRPQLAYSKLHAAWRNTAVVAPASSGIRGPKDLRSKIIGVPFGTNAHFYLESLLESHLLSPSEAKIRDVKIQDIPRLLKDGGIDAVATWEPWLSALEKEYGSSMIRLEDPTYTENSLLFGRKEAQGDARIRPLLQALYKSQVASRSDSKALRVVSSALGLDPADADIKRTWHNQVLDLGLNRYLMAKLRIEKSWAAQKGWYQTPNTRLMDEVEGETLRTIQPFLVTLVSPL